MKVPGKKTKAVAVEEDAGAEVAGLPESAVERLRYFGTLSSSQQRSYRYAVNEAFLEFIDTDPPREIFVEVMKDVNVTSVMLWTAMKAHI